MSAVGVNLALLCSLGLLALWGASVRRFGSALAVGCTVAMVGVAWARGVVIPADATTLPASAGLSPELLRLAAWGVFAAGASASGWREASRWAPLWMGAWMGELGGACLAAGGVSDPRQKARRVMLAAAGGLVGRASDPALLLLDGAGPHGASLGTIGVVAVLAALGAVVAAPPRVEGLVTQRSGWVLGLAGAAWGLSFVPGVGGLAIAAAGIGLWIRARARVPPDAMVRVAVLGVVGLVWVAAGGAELCAEVVEGWRVPYETQVPMLSWGAGALAGLVLGSDGAALMGHAVLDRALAVRSPAVWTTWALAAAVAGLGPYVVTRTVVPALPRHLLWVGASGGVVAAALAAGLLGP